MSNSLSRFVIAIFVAPIFLLTSARADFDFSGGKTIKGELKSAETHYNYKMEKGQTYAIDLKSDKIDCYLKLFDSKGNQVAEDDDSGVDLDSRILFQPSYTDTYKVLVTSFAAKEKGPFVLHMRPALFGELTKEKKEVTHDVELKIGQTYVIDMESGEFDSLLKIRTERGDIVKTDDDGGDFVHARVEIRPNRTAVYQIIASSFEQRGTGRYTISIREKK